MQLTTRNVNTAFIELVRLFRDGQEDRGINPVVRRPSRNGSVLVIDEPVTITYTHPRERVLFNSARDANPFALLYEALWMLAGRNDVDSLAHYTKRFREFSDDGKTLNGAYGYRWRSAMDKDREGRYYSHPIDQLDLIVSHLKANPTSRRAVLQMWNVEDDLLNIESSKDVCCNLSVMFSLREGNITHYRGSQGICIEDRMVLDMTVANRSNDLIWGMLGANYVCFSVLLEYVAARLGVEVGRYHHFSNNLHVYDDPGNLKIAPWESEKWLGDDEEDYYQLGDRGYGEMHTVSLVRDPEGFDRELPLLVSQHVNGNTPALTRWSEPFLNDVALPMFMTFHAYKRKDAEQRDHWCNQITADDWRIAATGWLQRRVKHHAG